MSSKFDIIMVQSKRKSLFGGAAPFSKAQLPTYLDVGKQFLQSKLELQASNSKSKITTAQWGTYFCLFLKSTNWTKIFGVPMTKKYYL